MRGKLAQALAIQAQRTSAISWETGIVVDAAVGVDQRIAVNCRGSIERVFVPVVVTGLTTGQVVSILRQGPMPQVLNVLSLTGDGTMGPAAPITPVSSGVSQFPALFSWTWDADDTDKSEVEGKRFRYVNDVQQGDNWPSPFIYRRGYWYHNWSIMTVLGGQGVVVDSARLRLQRGSDGPASATVTIESVDDWTRWPPQAGDTTVNGNIPVEPVFDGVGSPDSVSQTVLINAEAWFPISTAVAQAMVDADPTPSGWTYPPAYGVVASDNLSILGTNKDPQSGLIEITWHK